MERYVNKRVLLPLALLVAMVGSVVWAQNARTNSNTYKLSKEGRRYLMLINRHRHDDSARVYGDSLRMLAEKNQNPRELVVSTLGDFYAACEKYDKAAMERTAAYTREVAEKYGYMQYYHHTYANLVNVHIGKSNYAEAWKTLKKQQIDVEKKPDKYGQWLLYHSMAYYYKAIGNKREWRNTLKKAIVYADKVPDQSISQDYCNLGLSLPAEERMPYYMKSLEVGKTRLDTIHTNLQILLTYVDLNDADNFNKWYVKVRYAEDYPFGIDTRQQAGIKAFKEYYSGDKAKALNTMNANRRVFGDTYYSLMEKMYRNSNDYEKMLFYHLKADSIEELQRERAWDLEVNHQAVQMQTDSMMHALKEKDLMYKTMQADQARKAAENERLLAEKKKMEAERLHEQAEHERHQAVYAREKAENELLKARSKASAAEAERLKLNMGKIEAEQKVLNTENEQAHNREALIILVCTIIFLITAMYGAVYYGIRKRKNVENLRKLNSEVSVARSKAERANKMKDVFVQNMSHEIRTPLNAVMGFSQILTCPGIPISDEEKMEYGEHIMNNVNLLTMLIDDILSISDVQTGNYKITLREESIDQICKSAVSVTQFRIPTGVEFQYVNEMDENFTCVTDARRVQQVLVNYLSNACKHTHEGSIELRVKHDEKRGFIVFWVTDTGEGVPPQEAENIFERFVKLNNFVQGTGLGLNICRSISEKLNGHVWCSTEYTDGARFCFEFPDNLVADAPVIVKPQ